MKRHLGIIPIAGFGTRWGIYPKCLLPCGDREWLLDRAIRSFPGTVHRVVVVTSPQTHSTVASHIRSQELADHCVYVENTKMHLDFYGSILTALEFEADYYYFAMPDTFFPSKVFTEFKDTGISLGVHFTENPERYGMIRENRIVNKEKGNPGLAWGVLGWSKEIRDLWLQDDGITNYTQAINAAIAEFDVTVPVMDYYFDMATWMDYVEFIQRRYNEVPRHQE